MLIVEDDHTLRALFRSALVVAGYSITAVEDGADALRLIEPGALPTVIVLDLMLPRVSGRDVAADPTTTSGTRSSLACARTSPRAMLDASSAMEARRKQLADLARQAH